MFLAPFSVTVRQQFWLRRPDGGTPVRRTLQDHRHVAAKRELPAWLAER